MWSDHSHPPCSEDTGISQREISNEFTRKKKFTRKKFKLKERLRSNTKDRWILLKTKEKKGKRENQENKMPNSEVLLHRT